MLRRVLTISGLVCLACAPVVSQGPAQPVPQAAAPVVETPVSAVEPAVARADTTLIPRSVLFGNPEREAPELSPDGKLLLFIAPVSGVLNVWVGPADRIEAAKPITQDTNRGVRTAHWSEGGDRVLYLQDRGGDENWHLYAADPATATAIDLTPYPGVRAQLEQQSDRRPNEVVIGMNDRDPMWHDLYRVDVRTGRRALLIKNDARIRGYVVDADLKVRFATRTLKDGGFELLAARGKGWKQVSVVGLADEMSTSAPWLDDDGKTLYLLDSRGRETSAVVALDVATGKTRVLAEHPKASASEVLVERRSHRPIAAAFTHLRKEWRSVDKAVEADLAALRKLMDGDFSLVSQSRDDTRWVVRFRVDVGPDRFYLYDRGGKQAKLLFTANDALARLKLEKMRPVVIRARDKLELVSYYTVPAASDPDGDGVPDSPLPLVLDVHGGPWGRDEWGYSATAQWLANRGYAVLNVNFRGSTGFTKSFINAGDREMGGKMHDDLLDAVRWAVEFKIADPKRVAITGGSYGGYATLVGLAFTPEAFACGVDVVGPSNLETLLRSIPPYWASIALVFAARWGDVNSEEGRKLLAERSPLHRVSAITRPLLIGQGANDPRVKQAESDQIVAAMQAKGLPVTYVVYPDEGHGFYRPENSISFNAVTEAFLAGCLGGRYEPIGGDLKGSSIDVKVGAEHVPGLAAAQKG